MVQATIFIILGCIFLKLTQVNDQIMQHCSYVMMVNVMKNVNVDLCLTKWNHSHKRFLSTVSLFCCISARI